MVGLAQVLLDQNEMLLSLLNLDLDLLLDQRSINGSFRLDLLMALLLVLDRQKGWALESGTKTTGYLSLN